MRSLTFFDEVTQEQSTFLLPGEWDELSTDQLLFLIDLVSRNVSAEEIKLKILLFCLKGSVRKNNIDESFRIKIKRSYFDLSTSELHAICEIFDYLFNEEGSQIAPLLVRNHFPIVRIGWTKLYGPADGLINLTYQQFMELQIAHSEADNSVKKINDFISKMYKQKNGKSSRLFRFFPMKKKIAILWFYMGSMNFLQWKFPFPFSGEGSGDIADGQMRIVDALAKNDVTKKELVRRSDLYEALYTMQIAGEECEKLKRKD